MKTKSHQAEMPPSDFMIRSQIVVMPSSNNSRAVLSEHQRIIISRSESYSTGHVCICRKELKYRLKQPIFWKMQRQFLFFFLENYGIHFRILETHYVSIVAVSTFLGVAGGNRIGCSTTPTEHLELYRWPYPELKSEQWSSF